MTYARILSLSVMVATIATLGLSTPVLADTNLTVGGQGQVVNTNGDGVRIRGEPSVEGATLKVLDEGWRVTVVAGPVTGARGTPWYKISHTGTTGYVLAEFLAAASGANGGLTVGENAQVVTDDGASLRLREAPGGTVMLTMPNGAAVQVLAGPQTSGDGQRWYKVDYKGTAGWALGAYLQPVGQATAQRETTTRSGSRPAEAGAPTASGTGAAMAALAQRLIGAPYVFGGSTPAGFDCSGFVGYVARNAAGVQLGRDVFAQIGAGVAVDAKDLRPGDLVFQKNTYRWGLSHVGIYIGGGKMVSAQSESTGVTVANIWDGYWGPRYAGARRIA